MIRIQTLIAAGLVFWTASANAETYQAVSLLPPTNLLVEIPLTDWSKEISKATDGRFEFKIHAGGALLGAGTSLPGLKDGVAQIGFVAAAYYPKNFPRNNAVDDTSFMHTNLMSLAFAYTEFVMETPDMRKEWEDNGLVFIAGMNTPLYQLFCRSPIYELSDLAGKKIRTPGALLTRFSESVGATPVNAPFSEAYVGLERGAIDCVAADTTTLVSSRFMEVAKHVVTLDLGSYFLGTPWALSAKFWKDLSIEDRSTFLSVTARSLVRLEQAYIEALENAVEVAKANGVNFPETKPELAAAKQVFIDNDMGGGLEIVKTTLGVENAEIYRADLDTLVTKWDSLLANVDRTDEDALVALLMQEIYNDVSPTTYGVH